MSSRIPWPTLQRAWPNASGKLHAANRTLYRFYLYTVLVSSFFCVQARSLQTSSITPKGFHTSPGTNMHNPQSPFFLIPFHQIVQVHLSHAPQSSSHFSQPPLPHLFLCTRRHRGVHRHRRSRRLSRSRGVHHGHRRRRRGSGAPPGDLGAHEVPRPSSVTTRSRRGVDGPKRKRER